MEVKMTEEIWKPIKGFPNYEVSNLGRVKSIRYGRILKGNRDSRGYLKVTLMGNVQKTRLIHQLVFEAFVGSRPAGFDVAHIDDDKENPRLDNLALMTRSENQKMTVIAGDSFAAKITPADASEIRRLYASGGILQRELAKMFGLSESQISRIILNQAWQ
jgi:NUMOD4 motif/HNH endonuclease